MSRTARRILTFLLCSLPWLSAGAQQYRTNGHAFEVEPVPAWVEWTALRETSAPRVGQAVAYRLIDRQVRLGKQDETRFTRHVTEPLTEAGLLQAAEIEIDFNPAFQTLVLHSLNLVRDGHTRNRLMPEQVRLIQREQDFEKKLYDGIVTAVIIIDDVRLNDTIDIAYSVKGRNPVFGNKHFSAFAMGWEVPVDANRVRILAPRDRKLYVRAFNSRVEPGTRDRDGMREYRWALDDTPAVVSEDDTPSWHQPYPAIQVSEYRRWRDVSAWAGSLYTHSNALPPALSATLSQWRRETTDKKVLAARALKLVQDEVRYFGIELGQNSHRPSLPGDVYERRYGDCKDKTSLLIAMLEQLGIPAYPALVATDFQRDIDNWLPSPGLFDHVIVTTELDGQRYWLDGTRTYQQGVLDTLGMPDFERALIVRKGENRLTPIEIADTAVSTIEIEEKFIISDYREPVTLSVKSTYGGANAEALRRQFATNTPEAINRAYINYYAKLYPDISAIGHVVVKDDSEDNRFTTLERYRVKDFWESDDSGRTAYLVGATIAPYIKKPDSIQRAAPLALSHPVRIRHVSTLVYPEAIDYEIDKPDIDIEDDFVSYRRHVAHEGRRLTITHHYRTRRDAIEPAKLVGYYRNLDKIQQALSYNTWIGNVPANGNVGSMVDNLLKRLDSLAGE